MQMGVKFRQRIERQIARETIKQLLALGYWLGVWDGEETVLTRCTSAPKVLKAMFTTDEDYLLVGNGTAQIGWVRFIYGNDGYDVVNDYTTNLEPAMERVQELANKIEDHYFR